MENTVSVTSEKKEEAKETREGCASSCRRYFTPPLHSCGVNWNLVGDHFANGDD